MTFVKAQWDTLIALFLAIVVTALSLLDRIDAADVSKWTLAVLALLAITLVKDRQARMRDVGETADIRKTLVALDERLSGADEVQAVAPDAIGRWFGDAIPATTRWRFKGGTGTYLRAQTLPRLALDNQQRVEVWAEIVAPDDERVCERYGAHRRRGASGPTPAGVEEAWQTKEVRIQSYATVVAAIWYSEHMRVRVNVALTSTMSTIRQDMCDTSLLVTNEYARARGLAVVRVGGGGFFESSRRELEASFDQARLVDLRNLRLPRHEISGDDVLRVLKRVGNLQHDDAFLSGAVCTEIALMAISKEHAARLGVKHGGAEDPYPATSR